MVVGAPSPANIIFLAVLTILGKEQERTRSINGQGKGGYHKEAIHKGQSYHGQEAYQQNTLE
jgi:hypothetical protein